METLLNKKVVSIVHTTKGDEGYLLTFEDGQTLELLYSECEGRTILNGETIE